MEENTNLPILTGDSNNEKAIYDGAEEETEMFLCRANGKPKRPCVFCGKFQTHLTRHLKTKHKGEEDVIIAMQLPPMDRNQAFDVLKRKGYHNYNLLKMKEDDFNENKLIKERKPRKNRDGEIEKRAMCSSCKGFFVKEHMKNHKVKCFAAEGCTRVPVAIPIETVKDVKYSEEYKEDILSSFWDDQSGRFCRSDPYIKDFGFHYYRKMVSRKDKSQQNRKSIMKQMRTIANLYFFVKGEAEKSGITVTSALDLFKMENFHIFMDGINSMAAKDDGGMKSGLKKNVGHLIQNVLTHLKGQYILQNKKDEMSKVDDFKTLLEYYKGEIFSDAEYNCKKNRQENLRRPQQLPVEDDINKLRQFILTQIKELDDPYKFLEPNEYTFLRDLIVSRLTLFHAKRGGEPSRLTLKEWIDAKEDAWVDENQMKKVKNPEELELLQKYKLTYQSGKCVSHLLPILIPEDTWKAMTKLTDQQIRQAAGVKQTNLYVFPNIKDSNFHVCGWKSVNKICKKAELSKRINATQMRHYMSTVFANLEVADATKEAFYRHMGHSEEVNKHVYQCPLAIQEITKVGKFFYQFDLDSGNITAEEQPNSQEDVAGPSSLNDNKCAKSEEDEGSSELTKSTEKKGQKKFVIYSSSENDSSIESDSENDSSPESDYSTDYSEGNSSQKRGMKRKSEDGQIEEQIRSKKKGRRYVNWNQEDAKVVRTYFKDYVQDVSKEKSKGSLPGYKAIEVFMKTYPKVMANETDPVIRRDLIKYKVFNERNKTRKNYQQRKNKFSM
ncbi:uncharacterized protein LOC127699762 [Mytilus californianus]|uniref:uncharacterized protein LOC127699762 n=1 Tax=Mytilus californianus TaxID=6549 RepID=UPI002246D265|nr:uncharacterized protein LOC127699762 [Mytilus californianus]